MVPGIEQTLEDERLGLQSSEVTKPYKILVRGILATPNGLQWWDERKDWFSLTLQEEVEKLKEEVTSSDLAALSVHRTQTNEMD